MSVTHFYDPVMDSNVLFDEDMAIEGHCSQRELLDVIAHPGADSRVLKAKGIELTVFAWDGGAAPIHSDLAHRSPSPIENAWMWVHGFGGGTDAEADAEVMLALVTAINEEV